MSSLPRTTLPVSVIIDTYNYGRFVEDAINSVLGQSVPASDVEIIVVDDGSTDDTPARMEKYRERIRYIHKQNGGQMSAFNAGFRHARGRLIAFLDADDFWHPHKLERVLDEFARSPATDVVYHYLEVIDERGESAGTHPFGKGEVLFANDAYLKHYLDGELFWAATSGMTVRTECLNNLLPLPEDLKAYVDRYIGCIIPLYARRMALIGESLGRYRRHGSNLWAGKPVRTQDIMDVPVDRKLLLEIEKQFIGT